MEKQNKTTKTITTPRILDEKVGRILMGLDQFALQTSLPRPWHAEWQTLFRRVQIEIQSILEPKDPENG